MRVTASQRQELQLALLDAFPDRASLAQLVSFGLDVSLAVIAGEGPLSAMVFAVLEWITAHDQWPRFLEAAHTENPDNVALTTTIAQIQANARTTGLPSGGDYSPYRGLLPFSELDRGIFFGRETFSTVLLNAVTTRSLVAVLGPSGSGKSSVVFAGLVPALRAQPAWLLTPAGGYRFTPDRRPFRQLAAPLVALLEPSLSEVDRLTELDKLATKLQQGDLLLADIVARILDLHAPRTRLLLVADQFEELYTLCPNRAERERFLDVLLEAVTPSAGGPAPLCLVLTLRADFYGQALAHRPLADALQTAAVNLGPMTPTELRAAIEQPALAQGVTFEPGLTTRILTDVGDEPGNLPLLEFALTQLWTHRQSAQLTHTAYSALGSIGQALADYAEDVYGHYLSPDQDRIQRIMLQLVQPGPPDTRRVARRTDLEPDAWPLVARLANDRLVVTGYDAARAEETISVVHEALIAHWGRLRDWVTADREFRSWQERLRLVLHEWQASDRDEGALLRGALLITAGVWLQKRAAELSPAEQEFILTSQAREVARLQAEKVARERELAAAQALAAEQKERAATAQSLATEQQHLAEERQKRLETQQARAADQARANEQLRKRAIRLAVALGLALVTTVVAIGSTWVAEEQRAEADNAKATAVGERQTAFQAQATAVTARDIALAQARAAQAREQLSQNPELSVLLAMDAVSITLRQHEAVVPQAEAALHATLEQWPIRVKLAADKSEIWDAEWSPNGASIATAAGSGTVRIWNAVSGQTQFVLPAHTDLVHTVRWSPNGQYIVTASADKTARVWNTSDGHLQHALVGHTDDVQLATWSPDGQRVVTASTDGTARIWDATTGEQEVPLIGHSASIYTAMWNLTGKWIVTASADATARVWNAVTGESVATLGGHTDLIYQANWSPDGTFIATASADGTARVWKITPGGPQPVVTLQHRGHVYSAAWSPDGQDLLTTSDDGIARIWDTSAWQVRVQLEGLPGEIVEADWSPSGRQIATLNADGTLQLWDATKGQIELSIAGAGVKVNHVGWSPDGFYLVTGGSDGTSRVWDARGGEEGITLRGPTTGGAAMPAPLNAVAWSPDSRRIATGDADGMARIWDASSGQQGTPLAGYTAPLSSVAWSSDGKWIVTASADTTARVWNVDSHQVKAILRGHTASVVSAAWSPTGLAIATASTDGTGRIWDALSGRSLMVLTGHSGALTGATWSPDGRWVVTTSEDETARVWDATGRQPPLTLRGHTASVSCAAWSPDGRLIATGSADNTVRIWKAADGTSLALLEGHTLPVTAVAWSADGGYLATASLDHTARIWNPTSGQLLRTLQSHSDAVLATAWNPHANQLVTASLDGTINLWDVESDQPRATLRGHTGGVVSVAWSPDGTRIVTAGQDGTARQYIIDIAALLALGQARVGRPLSEAERAIYFAEGSPTAVPSPSRFSTPH